MKTQLIAQVKTSIFNVLETMFFLTLEEAKGDMPAPNQLKTAAISFSGAFSGTIWLEISQPLLESMTENFLGEDMDTLTQAHVDGTLKEALNMIAGSALTGVDNTAYMGLGIPEIVSSPGPVDETAVLLAGRDAVLAHIRVD